MTNKPESANTSTAPTPERKPYRAPRIEESGEFEHLVLACGKITGPLLACLQMPKSS